jgi:hypothetical protein
VRQLSEEGCDNINKLDIQILLTDFKIFKRSSGYPQKLSNLSGFGVTTWIPEEMPMDLYLEDF